MFEALVDRQDHHLAGTGELAGHQDAGDVRLCARRIAFVIGENFLNALGDFHIRIYPQSGLIGPGSGYMTRAAFSTPQNKPYA